MPDVHSEFTEESNDTSTSTEGSSGQDEYVQVRRADLNDIQLQLEEVRTMQLQERQRRHTPQQQRFEQEAPVELEVENGVVDPKKLAKFIQQQTAAATQQATHQISSEAQKVTWDNKAQKEFPLNDSDFFKAASAEMKALVASGEYAPNHPKLVYRASQLASMNYKGKSKMARQDSESFDEGEARPTSAAPSSSPTPTTRSRSKIQDNDPRVRFLKIFKPKASKEEVERFKSELEKTGSRIERQRNY